MPILYVNPAGERRPARVSGRSRIDGRTAQNPLPRPPSSSQISRARVGPGSGRPIKPIGPLKPGSQYMYVKPTPMRMRVNASSRKSPALAAYWAAKRKKKKGTPVMAKKKRRARRRPRHLAAKRPSRRRGRKSHRRAALLGIRRKKARRNPAKNPAKKRRGRRTAARLGWARRKRQKAPARRRPAKKRRRGRATAGRLGARRRKRREMYMPKRPSRASMKRRAALRTKRITAMTLGPAGARRTLKYNPPRRKRRRGRATAARLGWRRKRRAYGSRRTYRRRPRGRARRYRRNPGIAGIGTFLMNAAKKAVPVLISILGIRAATKVISPMIPVNLGAFQGPAVAAGMLVGAHFASGKVAFLRKHQESIMLGAGINLIEQLISAFAPPNVKAMIGMGGLSDYVAVSDYLQVGPGSPINDDLTLSDYVQVGMEEELGIDQELGMGDFEQELGMGDFEGRFGQAGLGGSKAMLAPIGSKRFLAPIPNRSFTQQVPDAGAGYDDPDILYTGLFGGGFGG